MANTTNLDLVKPLGTDHALISVINSNMDKIDAYAGNTDDSIGAVQDGMAIVANGDTHAAISAGQFVYVKNHNTLAEGLYTASAAIAQDAALSTSNLTADTSGGLNALNGKFTAQTTANLNDATDNNCVYVFNTGATNAPFNSGFLNVFAEGNNVKQIAIARGGTDAGRMVIRSRSAQGVWGDWLDIATDEILGLHKLQTTYSGTSRTVTYTAVAYAVLLVVVTSYAGTDKGAGVWIVTCYNGSSGGNITQLVNNNSGATLSITGNTLTVTAIGNIMIHALQ